MRYMQKNIGLDNSLATYACNEKKTHTKMQAHREKQEELEVEAMRRFVH